MKTQREFIVAISVLMLPLIMVCLLIALLQPVAVFVAGLLAVLYTVMIAARLIIGGCFRDTTTTMTTKFKPGDRVRATADVEEQLHTYGDPHWPTYGHVISIGGQSLIWVRDHLGGEWGLPSDCLEHID